MNEPRSVPRKASDAAPEPQLGNSFTPSSDSPPRMPNMITPAKFAKAPASSRTPAARSTTRLLATITVCLLYRGCRRGSSTPTSGGRPCMLECAEAMTPGSSATSSPFPAGVGHLAALPFGALSALAEPRPVLRNPDRGDHPMACKADRVEAERMIIYSQPAHSAVTGRAHCVMRPYGINHREHARPL